MNQFGNFLRFHPLIQLDSLLSGVENHITLRTDADVRLYFSAQLRVHRYVRVIGKLLQKLFTGKQRRSPLSGGKMRQLLIQLQARQQQAALDRRTETLRAYAVA